VEVTVGQVQTTIARTPESTTVVQLRGRIDQATADQLRRALVRVLMHEPGRGLVVDLDCVTVIDPLAIGMLQAAATTAEDMDRTIAFHVSGSPVADRLRREGIRDSRVAR
jgi:anti-anti-sigma factor